MAAVGHLRSGCDTAVAPQFLLEVKKGYETKIDRP